MNEKLHLVSFSGGKDSTAMLLHMMELGMRIDVVLWCDTGLEFPAMYEHVNRIKRVVEDAGIKFVTLKSDKTFEYYLFKHQVNKRNGQVQNGYSWADSRIRWCTNLLKTSLIIKYKTELNEHYEIVDYVGIAYDEQYRLERESNKNHIHPLVNWKWTEENALNYCYEKGYDWNGLYKHFSRVSCWCCPLQSLKDLKALYKNFPTLWNQLKDWDNQTFRKFRADYSVEELELKFNFEEEREKSGLSINPHTKDYRKQWELYKRRIKDE